MDRSQESGQGGERSLKVKSWEEISLMIILDYIAFLP